MTPLQGFHHNIVPLEVDGVTVDVATIGRNGPLEPIVFLHGFGSTKEDYADIVHHPAFDGRPFLAWDAPGCGESDCGDLSKVSIPFLVATAEAMLQAHGIDRFHLVGHSMGGLTALMLAHAHPGRVLSFVDIEGNVAPEDCFLSRQIVDYPSDSAERFFDDFIERTRHAPAFASAALKLLILKTTPELPCARTPPRRCSPATVPPRPTRTPRPPRSWRGAST
jgi:pimeloyl-ACP methyl ester carboxylesterase